MRKWTISLSIALLALTLAACGLGVNVKQDEQGNTIVDVSLPESVVNQILQGAVTNTSGDSSDEILDEIDNVDMKPGIITVTGKRTMPDGTKANGTFDLSLTAENGQLKASVSNIHIEGTEVTQETVNQINERIASALAQSASKDDRSEITSVSITDNALQMVVTIRKQ